MVRLLARRSITVLYSLCISIFLFTCRKVGSRSQRPVFLPRLFRTATFAGYYQIAGTRIPVRREHGGHGPCTSGGGGGCALFGNRPAQTQRPGSAPAERGRARGRCGASVAISA